MTTNKPFLEREKIKLNVEKRYWSSDVSDIDNDEIQGDEITEVIMNLTLDECEKALSKANEEFVKEMTKALDIDDKDNCTFRDGLMKALEIHRKTHGK